jgi:hypothetical protein
MLKNIPVLSINHTDCTTFILFDRNYQKYILVNPLHNWTFNDKTEMNNLVNLLTDIYSKTNFTISLDIYDYLSINQENFQYIDYDFLFSNNNNNAIRKITQNLFFDMNKVNQMNQANQIKIITQFLFFLQLCTIRCYLGVFNLQMV